MRIQELFEKKVALKTLYCSRDLLNGDEVVKWAEEQGFKKCLKPEDMHATIAYSKKKIDWSNLTDSFDTVISKVNKKDPKKTKREVKVFDGGAVVLTFVSGDLEARWKEFKDDFGASWDYPDYKPHVTITYDGLPEGMDLKDIEPFEGELKFGPEITQEVNSGWKGKVKEKKLTEATDVPVYDTKPFQQWFKNSKVSAGGKPIIVYHGTKSNFKAFSIKKSTMPIFWFTSDRAAVENGEVGAQGSGRILELYASIQNPAGWREYDQLGLGELKARGFDGAMLPNKNGHFTGFVFEPTQLKSATKNNGNFDAHNRNLDEETLYYMQPDGSYSSKNDGRSKGITQAEITRLGKTTNQG